MVLAGEDDFAGASKLGRDLVGVVVFEAVAFRGPSQMPTVTLRPWRCAFRRDLVDFLRAPGANELRPASASSARGPSPPAPLMKYGWPFAQELPVVAGLDDLNDDGFLLGSVAENRAVAAQQART